MKFRRLNWRIFSALPLFVFASLAGCSSGSSNSEAPRVYVITPKYAINVTVSGLTGSGLVLQNNGGDNLAISANGVFAFTLTLVEGKPYNVTVLTQPSSPSQICTVSNGRGAVGTIDVSVSLDCVNTYVIGGNVSGLAGTGLVLQNSGGDNLAISANGAFSFATKVPDAGAYAVSVLSQPRSLSQTCTASSNTGLVSGADVTNVSITCVTNSYTIGGTAINLSGAGMTLRNNGGDNLTVNANGAFSFTTRILDGGSYNVTLLTQPSGPGQTCAVRNGSGLVNAANVTNVVVYCPWTKQLGALGKSTAGYAIAIDPNGNIYVTGSTTGGLDGNTLTGTDDFFLTKYDNAGVKKYTRQLGVAGAATVGESVATDANGNVYVAGYTAGGLDGNTLTGTTDFFLTKYDSAGVKQYTKQLGIAGNSAFGETVATDANGNVYVAGYTSGGLDGNTLTGTTDFFLTKYDSTGVKQYTRQFGVASAATIGESVTTDANGNVYVAGYTTGGLDGNTLTGTTDFFLTKYDSAGAKQYTKQLGVTGNSAFGEAVATDANGSVYVAGYTSGGLDGNTLTGTTDFFLTKYDGTGAKQYTKQLGVAGRDTYGYSVATDATGNIYVAGYTNGGLDGNALTGTQDSFVTKYNSTGAKQYTKQLGVAGAATAGYSVTTNATGSAYVTGYTLGGLDGNALIGIQDFFIAKYDSAGAKQ